MLTRAAVTARSSCHAPAVPGQGEICGAPVDVQTASARSSESPTGRPGQGAGYLLVLRKCQARAQRERPPGPKQEARALNLCEKQSGAGTDAWMRSALAARLSAVSLQPKSTGSSGLGPSGATEQKGLWRL